MALAGILILVVFIITAVLLVLIVLIQDDQGGGIGGMFGGGESSSPFGSRTGNVLTKFTSTLGAVFLVAALALAWLNRTPDRDDFLERARLQSQFEAEEGQWWVRPATATEVTDAPQSEGADAAASGQAASEGTVGNVEAGDTDEGGTSSGGGSGQ
jgi:preprotein translocase subunit SecG